MNSKKITGLIVTGFIMASSVTAFAASQDSVSKERIYGNNRYETSVKISEKGWKNSSKVIICNGEGFADALCAVPLAKQQDAPILLTKKTSIDDKVKDEIERLSVSEVFIVGGEAAISKNVEDDIKNIPSVKKVQRFSGKDRYETSLNIAKNIKSNGEVVLTTGKSPADALSISSIAANNSMPIILVPQDKTLVKEYIKDNKVNKGFIIGGKEAVSKDVENILPNYERIYGENRFSTNEKIIKRFSDSLVFKNIYVSLGQSEKGDEFADALSSAALAAKEKAPMILVYKDINEGTQQLIKSKFLSDSKIVVIGGEKLISNDVVEKIAKVDGKLPSEDNKNPISPSIPSNPSTPSNPSQENSNYVAKKQASYPGALTYDISIIGKNGQDKLTSYKLVYDGKIIAEDIDGDGIIRPLAIFFGYDVDKSKFKIMKDGKEITVNGLK